ncbi:uncharacterized protein BX664DRAFT_388992 [Halteromyces radiatus]|uniref:uncharacterized protein n=1 Tax=Halteromyces radiatus TaxID=101107 RepID=UPI002220F368|nr:uncharacterized protein BX664DRAFT_388992 [Halteromyces radiatus]KAI8080049.1 hypothetical protein BX664DRAFT_388992 [Halteromyces radiatus]
MNPAKMTWAFRLKKGRWMNEKTILKEPRKTIAVNLDETLSHTYEALLNWHNDFYHTQYRLEDLTTTDLWKVWGGSREDTCHKIRLFYQSEYFQTIQPIQDFALEALKMLKKRKFQLVIITSRQQFIAEETKRFVDKHYPGIFESIYFCNLGLSENEQLEYISKTKSTICQEIGVDVLIDHQLEHCMDCADLGMDVLLYDRKGQYQWNHHQQQYYDNIKRVTTWRDIIRHHFPKPNSPLRHLIYSMDQQQQQQDDDDDDDDDDYDQHEVIVLEQNDEDEEDEWSMIV